MFEHSGGALDTILSLTHPDLLFSFLSEALVWRQTTVWLKQKVLNENLMQTEGWNHSTVLESNSQLVLSYGQSRDRIWVQVDRCLRV